MAEYIMYSTNIDVYSKPGFTDDTLLIFVRHEAKLYEVDAMIPGASIYYVIPEDDGRLVLWQNFNDFDEDILDYLRVLINQDNAADFMTRVRSEFIDLMVNNLEILEYREYMEERIMMNVGVVLAQMFHPDITADMLREDENNGMAVTSDNVPLAAGDTTWLGRTTTVVNIRSSDSETAERLDRAIAGQEFTILEQKINGWSRVRHMGRDAYIKSEFIEIISEIGGSVTGAATIGTVRLTSNNVRVRSTASTSGSILGTVAQGTRLSLVEQMTNGWSKVIFNDQIGYIRSDFLTVE
jgi:hypothetical protein